MTRPLVVGNWKMNLDYVEAVHLIQQVGVMLKAKPLEHVDVVVVPPFVDLRSVTSVVESERIPVAIGAQHVSIFESGAHTGEISSPMLTRMGVRYVLVGHSERRAMYAMSDDIVASTVVSAAKSGLHVILCCGEDLSIREAGRQNDFVADQIHRAVAGLPESLRESITIAYEPIWAIGTGLTASSDQVAQMTEHLRAVATSVSLPDVRILYGGSVNADNASSLMLEGLVDGFLVGGASLKAEGFVAIAAAAHDCYAGRR